MKITQYRDHWTPVGAEKAWARYSSRAPDMQTAVDLCVNQLTAVQAGGNIGAWPVWLAHRFIEVITFEPENKNFACLKRNTETYHNITSYHAALSDHIGTSNLRVCRSIGSHFLLPGEGETKLMTIDSLNLDACSLIVLDVEGYEYEALVGARETREKFKPVIHLEDRGHGVKKGTGKTFDDIQRELSDYTLASRIGRDVVFTARA